MNTLYVLYDAECELCRRSKAWLARQPAYLRLEFIPYQAPDLDVAFPGIGAFRPDREILVVSDNGDVYQGPEAWIMCLYSLRAYRVWAFRMASPALRPLVRRFVGSISLKRRGISRWLSQATDDELVDYLDQSQTPCS